jgi:hypothetical protein
MALTSSSVRRAGRIGAVVLAAAMATVAGGCGGGTATPPVTATPLVIYVTPSPAETTTPPAETTTPAPTPAPTAAPAIAIITTVTVTDSATTPMCGTWHLTFKKPVVAGVPHSAAINAAIAARVTNLINDFKAMAAGEGSPGAGPCTFQGTYYVGINSPTLLGFGFSIEEYLGGASTSTVVSSLNFRESDGSTIALSSLFTTPAAAAAALSTRSRALLPVVMPDGDTDWINTGTTAVMANFDRAWVFKASGLVITFPEEQVGPTAAGTPSILVSWASISGVLRPDGPAGEFHT